MIDGLNIYSKRYVGKPLARRIIGEGRNQVMGPTERQGHMVLSLSTVS